MANLRDSPDTKTPSDILSVALIGALQAIRLEDLFVTCLSCKHLGDKGTQCNKYPGYPIPAHIVLNGCKDHEDVNKTRAFGRVNPQAYPSGQRIRDVAHLDDDIPF